MVAASRVLTGFAAHTRTPASPTTTRDSRHVSECPGCFANFLRVCAQARVVKNKPGQPGHFSERLEGRGFPPSGYVFKPGQDADTRQPPAGDSQQEGWRHWEGGIHA